MTMVTVVTSKSCRPPGSVPGGCTCRDCSASEVDHTAFFVQMRKLIVKEANCVAPAASRGSWVQGLLKCSGAGAGFFLIAFWLVEHSGTEEGARERRGWEAPCRVSRWGRGCMDFCAKLSLGMASEISPVFIKNRHCSVGLFTANSVNTSVVLVAKQDHSVE